MDKEYTEKFKKIYDDLYDMNQRAVKENNEEAKNLSCYLLEIIDETEILKS